MYRSIKELSMRFAVSQARQDWLFLPDIRIGSDARYKLVKQAVKTTYHN